MTDFYTPGAVPAEHATGSSAVIRTEYLAIQTAFGKLPDYTGNGTKVVFVNAGGTAYAVDSALTYNASTDVLTVNTSTFGLNSQIAGTLGVTGVLTATGGVVGNVTGNTSGTAGSAATLTTARTINGISFNGSANITITIPESAWSVITADPGPAVVGGRYMANTTAAAFSVTLPAAPAASERVVISDYAGTWATNALTIARNGLLINGIAEDMTCNTNWLTVTLDYIDVTVGWRTV